MFQYIIKRILWLIPILLGVSFIVFTIMYLSPGDPVTMILGDGASEPPDVWQLFQNSADSWACFRH